MDQRRLPELQEAAPVKHPRVWIFREQLERARTLGAMAYRLYAEVCVYADKTGVCWPFVGSLADRCGWKPRAVQRAMRQLEEAGLVSTVAKVTGSGNTSNRYTVLPPGGASRDAPCPQGHPSPSTETPAPVPTDAPLHYEGQSEKDIQRRAADAVYMVGNEDFVGEEEKTNASTTEEEKEASRLFDHAVRKDIDHFGRPSAWTMKPKRWIAALGNLLAIRTAEEIEALVDLYFDDPPSVSDWRDHGEPDLSVFIGSFDPIEKALLAGSNGNGQHHERDQYEQIAHELGLEHDDDDGDLLY